MSTLDSLFGLFEDRGRARYGQEAVSQLHHGLQCAALAVGEGAEDPLVLAALFHDVGHLLHPDDLAAANGVDDKHESAGAAFLSNWFGPSITQPVRLHVTAKRYLMAVEPCYEAKLSPASILSLRLQGGPLSRQEADLFAAEPHAAEAVRVRRWDEAAKVPEVSVPSLAHYRAMAERYVLADGGRRRAKF